MFIGLPGSIDGLVHLSDLSWSEAGRRSRAQYKKGDEVEAMVLSHRRRARTHFARHQAARRRPVQQLRRDQRQGHVVDGTVKSVDAKGAVIALERRRRRLSARLGNRARPRRGCPHPPEGRRHGRRDDHQHRPQVRTINLSIKAKDTAEETEAIQKHGGRQAAPAPARPTSARC